MATKTTLKQFESVFPRLVEDILAHAEQYKLPEQFSNWYRAVSDGFPLGLSYMIMNFNLLRFIVP
jgi:farnesyl diphosphate synthase